MRHLPLAAAIFHVVLEIAATAGSTARAQDTPYCQQVRAQAASEAAVLLAPHVFASGLRFPSANRIDVGPTVGTRLQGRVGGFWSLIDTAKGVHVLRAGKEQCALHEASEALSDWARSLGTRPFISAHSAQASYLEGQRSTWLDLLIVAEERFRARVITALEVQQIRRTVAQLERELAQANGQAAEALATLHASNENSPSSKYIQAASKVAERSSALRQLEAWELRGLVGVVPFANGQSDWYGMVELSYSLGGPFQHSHERKFRRASREDAERRSLGEDSALGELQPVLQERLKQARDEERIVAEMLTSLSDARARLESSEAGRGSHQRDQLLIEQIATESQLTYLRALSTGLAEVTQR